MAIWSNGTASQGAAHERRQHLEDALYDCLNEWVRELETEVQSTRFGRVAPPVSTAEFMMLAAIMYAAGRVRGDRELRAWLERNALPLSAALVLRETPILAHWLLIGPVADWVLRRDAETLATDLGGWAQVADVEIVSGVKVWRTVRDERVRHSHEALQGQTQPLDQPFISGAGNLLMHPGDQSLGAGLEDVINCRCVITTSLERQPPGYRPHANFPPGWLDRWPRG